MCIVATGCLSQGDAHACHFAQPTHCPPRPAGSQQLTLTGGELEALRRQLADQEILLKAYQAENELAAQRIKQQQAEHKSQAAEAAAEMEELQHALTASHADRERQPPGTPAVDAARLQELLQLQSELEAARGTVAQHGRELQQQVGGCCLFGWESGWHVCQHLSVLPGSGMVACSLTASPNCGPFCRRISWHGSGRMLSAGLRSCRPAPHSCSRRSSSWQMLTAWCSSRRG